MTKEESRQKLEAFFKEGKELSYVKKSMIVGYGDFNDMAYFIVNGQVSVVSSTKDGFERIQYIYQEKELFPLKMIFDKMQYDVAFFAFSNVTLLMRPISDFLQWLEDEPKAMLAIIHQQTAMINSIVNLHYETAEQRIVFRLITLAERFGVTKNMFSLVVCPITVQELANSVRVSSATAGKILNRLEKEGAIALKRQNILVDPKRLQRILDEL